LFLPSMSVHGFCSLYVSCSASAQVTVISCTVIWLPWTIIVAAQGRPSPFAVFCRFLLSILYLAFIDSCILSGQTAFAPVALLLIVNFPSFGVCLTVVAIEDDNIYTVTAIKETLDKSSLKHLKVGDLVNLERAMKLGERLDGHIVQGHVDQTATCTNVENADGSWVFTFEYDTDKNNITIEKGSITINGVSLTVVNSQKNTFSVAIIPYTFENTNFKSIKKGTEVNLEFDVIGKYVARLLEK